MAAAGALHVSAWCSAVVTADSTSPGEGRPGALMNSSVQAAEMRAGSPTTPSGAAPGCSPRYRRPDRGSSRNAPNPIMATRGIEISPSCRDCCRSPIILGGASICPEPTTSGTTERSMSTTRSTSTHSDPPGRGQPAAAAGSIDAHDVAEQNRLNEAREAGTPWKKWGPYVSERQWGTVREDYSDDGNAWDYFSHDQARSRAYRWGEDGLAGICDEKQLF